MRIQYLGHAGFVVETPETVVVMDPWLSPAGAFDSAWFQFPRNHHLAGHIRDVLADGRRARYLYISHSHQDHFDRQFLDTLGDQGFTVLVPHFRGGHLRRALSGLPWSSIVTCGDGDRIAVPGGEIRLFVDDRGLNQDSAVLVRLDGHSFLNLNDCKIHERLPAIIGEHGAVDAFACQFSGASWHPTCYDYPHAVYADVARRKTASKFEAVARALETTRPRFYLPSAGPPVFLDPELLHLNFEPVSIFARVPRLVSYLEGRLNGPPRCPAIMPGDVVDLVRDEWLPIGTERVEDEEFEAYVCRYAAEYSAFWETRPERAGARAEAVLEALGEVLTRKLLALTVNGDGLPPLYFGVHEVPDVLFRVDFQRRAVDPASSVRDAHFYRVSAPAWQLARAMSGELPWDNFALTFRARFTRVPDVYSTAHQAFLLLEPADMRVFAERSGRPPDRQERMVVEAGGRRYCVDRYCPHQNGDLSRGWVEEGRFLVCPRHRWRFDLREGGRCSSVGLTISAEDIERREAEQTA